MTFPSVGLKNFKIVFASIFLLDVILSQKCGETKLRKNGVVTLIGLFSIRACEPNITVMSILRMEAMIHAIERANLQSNDLHDDLFGYSLYDTDITANFDLTSECALELFYNTNEAFGLPNAVCPCLNKSKNLQVLGLIGPAESPNAIYFQQLASTLNFPIISYSATSSELSNKSKYKNFFRTVPPDTFQAKAFTDFILKFNWTYVSILASDNDYGRDGLEELKKNFEAHKICINFENVISDVYKEEKYKEILKNLISTGTTAASAEVIIVWGYFNSVKKLLIGAKELLLNKTWIFSHANQMNPWFIDFKKSFQGTIILVIPTVGHDKTFEEYFLNISYKNANSWVRKMFETIRSSDASIPDHTRIRDLNYTFDFNLANFARTAVDIYVQGYSKFHGGMTGGEARQVNQYRDEFFKIIQEIEVSTFDNKNFSFDLNQDPNLAMYEFFLVNESNFISIANWSSLINASKLLIKENSGWDFSKISSICSQPCPAGSYPIRHTVNKNCCWTCVECEKDLVKTEKGLKNCTPCERGEFATEDHTECKNFTRVFWSFKSKQNIVRLTVALLTSALGSLTSIFFILTYVSRKHSPIVRSSNFHMTMIQMNALLFSFLFPILFMGEDSHWKCVTRTYGSELLFFVSIASSLAKVTTLISVFGSHHKLTKNQKTQLKLKEFLTILTITLLYISVISIMQNVFPLKVIEYKDTLKSTAYSHCHTIPFWIANITCIFIILVSCAVQFFRGRKLPGKYNDAKFISYALFSSTLVKIISIPIGISLVDNNNFILLIWLQNNVSSFLLLTILYSNKVKIIFCNPKRNTVKEFRRSFESSACDLRSFEL